MDLNKIKEKLTKLKDGGAKKNGFWKTPKGESIIRICPTKQNDSFFEYFLHYNIGKEFPFLCPRRNFKEDCPVCNFANELWNNEGDDAILAKKFFAKQRFYSPVLVRGEEQEGIRWWSYSKSVYEGLLRIMLNEDYGDITDPETGTDLVINYDTPKGKLFPDTTIQPRRKSSRFCDDLTSEECSKIIDSMADIMELLGKKTESQIREALDKYLLSGDSDAEEVSKETEKYGSEEEKKDNKKKKKDEEKSDIDKAFDELLPE